MANLKISKLNNYIHILDMDRNVLFTEHSFRVLVKKLTPTGNSYDIIFLRPDVVSPFYSATIGSIYDSIGSPFSQADWELWYQKNTGDVNATSIALTTTQANVLITPEIYTVTVTTSMSAIVGSTSKLLTLSIYNQDLTNPISISTDGGSSSVSVPKGVTINYDAGGLLNYFDPNNIVIDPLSTTLKPIIIYTYIF